MRNGNHCRLKACLSGLAGGAAGTGAMNLYMKGMQKALKDESHLSREQNGEQPAELAYTRLTHREPGDETKNKLSNVVHWGYRANIGGAYGLIRGRREKLDIVGGFAYGAALRAFGDELAVPLLGLAEGPKAYPKSIHAETFGAHLVHGVTTAAVTQLLERVI
jgi:hypothetical protein